MLPRLIQLGPFTLYSFGLMVILGFGAGIALAGRLARERSLPEEAFLDGGFAILLSSIVGARLLFVLLNWHVFAAHLLDIGAVWQGGMSFHGGVAGGVLAAALYLRARRLPLLPMADAAAPGLALGYAIGRVGCFLNGCCYGGPTDLPWGVAFPNVPDGLRHHPTQLYATVLNLGLMALLVRLYRRPHHLGQVMAAYVAGYSTYRFAIESLRKGYTADVLAFGLTQAQVFSLLAIAAGLLWWFWLSRRTPLAPEVAAPAGAPSHAV